MTRDIKFRYWHKAHKRFEDAGYMFSPDGFQARGHIIPLQYTGLKDRDGKEIYEGDIIKGCHYDFDEDPDINDYTYHKVEWGGEYPAFTLEPTISDEYNDLSVIAHGYEDEPAWMKVVGNIYETPELLK